MKTNPLFSTFDLADIDRMQFGFFRQFFLTQTRFFAVSSNGVS